MAELSGTWIVNGNIYTPGTDLKDIPEADLELLKEKKAMEAQDLPDYGTVSLDDQEQAELEKRGVVERPARDVPGTFIAGEVPEDSGGLAAPVAKAPKPRPAQGAES
jgi:hypothetical protein